MNIRRSFVRNLTARLAGMFGGRAPVQAPTSLPIPELNGPVIEGQSESGYARTGKVKAKADRKRAIAKASRKRNQRLARGLHA